MAGQSSSRGSLPLTRFKSSKIAAVVIITFIIVLCLLVTLLPHDFTSNIIAPYIDKASDLWHGGVVRQGREAARGALAEVGMKQSFRSRRCVRLKLKLKRSPSESTRGCGVPRELGRFGGLEYVLYPLSVFYADRK